MVTEAISESSCSSIVEDLGIDCRCYMTAAGLMLEL